MTDAVVLEPIVDASFGCNDNLFQVRHRLLAGHVQHVAAAQCAESQDQSNGLAAAIARLAIEKRQMNIHLRKRRSAEAKGQQRPDARFHRTPFVLLTPLLPRPQPAACEATGTSRLPPPASAFRRPPRPRGNDRTATPWQRCPETTPHKTPLKAPNAP